ncbi:hypothetical protein [Aneurinibacillus tyrosinisolvens]|uniref:hypothetical protein n=1 Tax=Aneurinibacillus tyrosinisolvens TaxID=1443435 RepID=UPI00063FD1F0|nr:hypothetical protein [Aneurinibacillus tyrosinisolvens]
MKKWLMFFILLLSFCSAAHAKSPLNLIITVKTSPQSELASTLRIQNGLAERILASKTAPGHQKPDLIRATLTVGNRQYDFDSYSQLYERATHKKILLSVQTHTELEKCVGILESSHYGKALSWEQIRKEFRRMSYARVVDMETGKSFEIQRRAGSRHADVQPVTLQDTKIMKDIYKGKWSWRRRAIVVLIDGKRYAASMNGMPHGAGAIRGNGFRGHFCIHFKDSSTHRRSKPDPSHHLMILKASGQLRKTIMNADPHRLIDYFLIALNEHDATTLALTMEGALPFPPEKISFLKKQESKGAGGLTDHLTAEIPVKLSYIKEGEGKKNEVWTFLLRRASPLERWTIVKVDVRKK